MGRVDHPNFLATGEEVASTFETPFIDEASDTLLGFAADGTLVACARCRVPPVHKTLVRSVLEGGVHPEWRGRGIGRVLFAWQMGRGKQQLAASDARLPGWLMAETDERAPGNSRLYEHAGFKLTRSFLTLERRLDEPIRTFKLADGVRIEQFRPEISEAVRLCRNEAFMDHWGSQPTALETWQSQVEASVFRNDLSFVALAPTPDGDRIVGFVLSTVNEDGWVDQGFEGSYISLVGILGEWRGRRIAQALLSAHLTAGRAAGLERTTLDVDADSPTGAMGLYTGMGFTPTTRELDYTITYE